MALTSTGPARESNFIETHFLKGPDEYIFSVDVDINHDPDSTMVAKESSISSH